jgi:hypothetical protein
MSHLHHASETLFGFDRNRCTEVLHLINQIKKNKKNKNLLFSQVYNVLVQAFISSNILFFFFSLMMFCHLKSLSLFTLVERESVLVVKQDAIKVITGFAATTPHHHASSIDKADVDKGSRVNLVPSMVRAIKRMPSIHISNHQSNHLTRLILAVFIEQYFIAFSSHPYKFLWSSQSCRSMLFHNFSCELCLCRTLI